MYIIGIDPGKGGGIVVITLDGEVQQLTKMPDTPAALLEALMPYSWSTPYHRYGVAACLEQAQASPQMGVVSAFTYGKGYGELVMALEAMRIAYTTVRPRTWQKELACLTGGDKNISKAKAIALFPNWPITHATADALLIAEYTRRNLVRGQEHVQAKAAKARETNVASKQVEIQIHKPEVAGSTGTRTSPKRATRRVVRIRRG